MKKDNFKNDMYKWSKTALGAALFADCVGVTFGGQQKRYLLVDILEALKKVVVASILWEWRQTERAEVFLFVNKGYRTHERAQNQLNVIFKIVNLQITQVRLMQVHVPICKMLVGKMKYL